MSEESMISSCQSAIRAMREGRFDVAVPADSGNGIGRLGQELNELAGELEKKFDETSKLQEISEEIVSGMFLDDVLNRAYESFSLLIPYNRMGCALLSADKREATAYWAKTDASTVQLRVGHTAAMAGSSLMQVIETGQPRILNDLEAYLAEHPASATTRLIVEEGMRSSLTCPLVAQGKPVGFLFFSSREKNTYRNLHQDIFMHIAGQISILVEKSRLYEQLYELNQKLLFAQRELKHQATHDVLTGVYNRGAIIEHLEAQLARARRHNQSLGVILIDIDHFKHINDTHGHHAGDAVLKTLCARLEASLREYDYFGRYGGEEFLVVLGDHGQEAATRTAERLRKAVADEPIVYTGRPLAVTISAGVAVAEDCAEMSTEHIIMAADHALYKAKSGGRNRFELSQA